MRSVATGVTDQTIVVNCFDSDEAAVTLTSGSAGLAISYRVDVDGREGTPVSMTPVARTVAGQHRDGAITSKGGGKHEIDLPDAAFASAGFVSVILTATDVTGRVYSEVVAVGITAELDSVTSAKIDSILEDTGTTLPTQISGLNNLSGGASLEDIIAGVQSVSGAIVEAQNSASLSIRIGDTWTQEITSLGNLTNKVVTFAIKKRASDADTAAIVFITEGTGLTRLNGAATTAVWGSITIDDETAGDITLRLESDATSQLTSGSYVDAVKLLEDGDDRSPRNAGRTVVTAGVIADIT